MEKPLYKVGEVVIFKYDSDPEYCITLKGIYPHSNTSRDAGTIWFSEEYEGRTYGENYMRKLTKLEKALK